MKRKFGFCLAWLVLVLFSACGSSDDGVVAPEVPQDPIESWRVESESSFDIRGLTCVPSGGLIGVGGSRILTNTSGNWADTRLDEGVVLGDVWATDALSLAVGDDGLVLSRTSDNWEIIDVGISADLNAVSGRNNSDVFVVGDNGTILHFDGLNWINLSIVSGETFMDVWCCPTGENYAVSVQGNIWSDTAGEWDLVDLEISNYIPEELLGIVGLSNSFILAYGDHERVLLFDGSSWIIDRDGPSAHSIVSMVFGPDENPIAVTDGRNILTRSGGSWQGTASLGFPVFPASLAVDSESQVYLGGSEAGVLQMDSDPGHWDIIHRYWTDDIVASVSGSGDEKVLLAESGVIWKFLDGNWTATRPEPGALVARGWSADGNTIFTIGAPDQVRVYSGQGYSMESLGLNMVPRGIDGIDDSTLLIVGREGKIIHGTTGNWTEQASGTTENLLDVRFLTSSTALVVGTGGTVLFWDGLSWQAEFIDTEATLGKLAVGPQGKVYALGWSSGGGYVNQVFIRSENTWQALGETAHLGPELITDITVDETGRLRACSSGGLLFLYEETRWYQTESKPEFRLNVINYIGNGTVLAAGGDGVILTYSDQ